ncbi:MAG: hypothetical protein KGM99_12990, partial [Burkholderiales bacterium]|nr:hypothetical protein [Burkholderiales bacterium]
DGGDVKFSNFHCVKPAIPDVSKSNEEIKQVTASINAWLACYNDFVTHLNGVLPAGKAIPKDLGNIMNDQEMGRAMNLMDKTYSAIASDANSQTQAILKKQEEWKKATEVYVAGVNEKIRRENEILQREMDAKMATRGENRRDPTGPGVPSKR